MSNNIGNLTRSSILVLSAALLLTGCDNKDEGQTKEQTEAQQQEQSDSTTSSSSTGQKVSEAASAVQQDASNAIDTAKEKIADKVSAAKDKVADLSSSAVQGVKEGIASTQDKTLVLRVGTSLDYPPFESTQNGQPVGFEIDLVNAIAAKLDGKVEITNMPFANLLAAVKNKKLDLIIAGITSTPDRAESIDFSKSYYTPKLAIVSMSSKPVKALSDNIVVAVQTGSVQYEWVKAQSNDLVHMKVVTLDNVAQIFEELKAGHVDAIAVDDAVAKGFIQGKPTMVVNVIEDADLPGIAIGLPKDSPMLAQVNSAITDLLADGTVEKLREKWSV